MNKLKALIGSLLGIKEWKLKADGHLDITDEELLRLHDEYGQNFIDKFEKLLSEGNEDSNLNINQPKSDMPKILTLALICAALNVKELQAADDGSVTLNEEQLNALEAALKKLQDEKAAVESTLATAKTEKDTAEKALSDATAAMDELDATVKAADTPAKKVEAIRQKLAEKPGAAATGIQTSQDGQRKAIEGADPVTSYAKGLV